MKKNFPLLSQFCEKTLPSNSFILNKWESYHFELKNFLISDSSIKEAFKDFFNNKLKYIPDDFIIVIQFKVKLDSGEFRSISRLQIEYIKDHKNLVKNFIIYWNNKTEDYYVVNYSHIIFTYKIISIKSKIKPLKNKINFKNKKIKTNEIQGYNLPNTMDFNMWGNIIEKTETIVIIKKNNSELIYFIKILKNELDVELRSTEKTLIKFKDKKEESDNLNSFTREIWDLKKHEEYFFVDGELKLKKIRKNVRFLKPLLKDAFLSSKFITMDLETRNINGELSPYCISTFNGKLSQSFYLSDYKNSEEMIKVSIQSLMRKKYNGYKVYLHNFSYFDSVFMLSILSSLTNFLLKPKIRDGRIINFPFNFIIEGNKKKYTLNFRDSYLLLPSSLRELSRSFHTELKGIFPYDFVNNENISLLYEGIVPTIKYFKNISENEYNIYCKSFKNLNWNLKEETTKYCEQDCMVLYHIIKKFSMKIFSLFKVDIQKYPTLPSLSFGIYRSNFFKEIYFIPLIQGEIFKDLKKAYTGGAVDVYKPYGRKVNRYDVNSLYPSSMRDNPMPTGSPTYFEGDISLKENKPFGIFEVEITSPDNLEIPILQLRFRSDKGIKTLSPLGKWTSWYFSEELYNASEYGYSYKILRGYLFEKKYIFKEFVEFLYDIKRKSGKNSPDYIISKMLLNSLYGRLGMDPVMEKHLILSSEEALKYYNLEPNVIPLNNGKELISFFEKNDYDKSNNSLNVSVPISTAVTAYGRIHMSKFKMMFLKLGITLYYSDTDSFDIDQLLDQIYISNELGKLKKEHTFEEAVYLAPKVYGGKNKDYEYVRIKGLKNPISYKELKSLLFKNKKLKIPQEKWYRDFSKSKITIKKEIYSLMITENKRKLIFSNKNKFIDTEPLTINNEKIVN